MQEKYLRSDLKSVVNKDSDMRRMGNLTKKNKRVDCNVDGEGEHAKNVMKPQLVIPKPVESYWFIYLPPRNRTM